MATTNTNNHAGQPVFISISHPILKRPGFDAKVRFIKDRKNYTKWIADANISGATLTPVSLLSSIDEDLLRSMVMLDMLPGAEKYEDITDQTISRWLNKIEFPFRPPTTPKQITDAVVKNVRISYEDSNPRSRIESLFIDYITFLRSKNWDFIITKNTDLAVSHICTLIRPYALQEHIEIKLSLEEKGLRSDWIEFFTFVTNRAAAYEEFHPLGENDKDMNMESIWNKETV